MYTLYVIPGSHACRSAMLMLDHKRLPYRRVEFVTLTHPVMARVHGFDARGEKRTAAGKRTLGLRLGDLLGTVPALAAGKQRISTNHGIARFLDEHHPDPPLFPADPERRREVEEAERWANETLQMAARRIPAAATLRDPAEFSRLAGQGRLGHLLYRRRLTRRVVLPLLFRSAFAASPEIERDPATELPALLDQVDAWIETGVLGGAELNAADLMVAPSLALILYRPDVRPMFAGRPSLELVDRLLPEPAQPRLGEPAGANPRRS
jgi:glutathione S-transferase